MRISKIFNGNVYVDGTSNLLGKASEITLPDIAVETDEHMALGMIGKVSLPTGLALMEAKIKWAGFYAEQLVNGANPFQAHKLQVRASVESYEAEGRVEETPLVVLMTCRWKKTPLGVIGAQAATEYEEELTVTYVKVTLGGKELIEVDVLENVWKVNGVDILAQYRKNIGG
jgi:P2 family phage contractile tail tube protein